MNRKKVVCAWIEGADGRVLLTQRKAGAHLEHLWEFAGGKVEPGETDAAALARELEEEIGVQAVVGEEIARTEHHYGDRIIELILLRVTSYQGEVQALDVAAFQWVTKEWLRTHPEQMPPADVPLVARALS